MFLFIVIVWTRLPSTEGSFLALYRFSNLAPDPIPLDSEDSSSTPTPSTSGTSSFPSCFQEPEGGSLLFPTSALTWGFCGGMPEGLLPPPHRLQRPGFICSPCFPCSYTAREYSLLQKEVQPDLHCIHVLEGFYAQRASQVQALPDTRAASIAPYAHILALPPNTAPTALRPFQGLWH